MNRGQQPSIDEDAQLLRAYAEGDEGAFAELFDRQYDRVYRLAYRYAGNASDAEDLAQTVFLKVMGAASTFEPRARFTTWLFRVTANECLSHLRRLRRTPEVAPSENAPEPAGDPDSGPEGSALRGELAEVVRRAVLSLPKRQRLAVVLSRYEGLSYVEIADAMDLSVQAVKSLLNRAHTALRTKLRPYVEKPENTET